MILSETLLIFFIPILVAYVETKVHSLPYYLRKEIMNSYLIISPTESLSHLFSSHRNEN